PGRAESAAPSTRAAPGGTILGTVGWASCLRYRTQRLRPATGSRGPGVLAQLTVRRVADLPDGEDYPQPGKQHKGACERSRFAREEVVWLGLESSEAPATPAGALPFCVQLPRPARDEILLALALPADNRSEASAGRSPLVSSSPSRS